MELELNTKTMQALAKEIARAQLTAVDDLIDEVTATWPDKVKEVHRVPRVGDVKQNGQPVTSAERFEAFRAVRPAAERHAERVREQQEKNDKAAQAARERRESEVASTLERNQAEYDAAMASWRAQCVVAKQQGLPHPPEPVAPPLTRDDLARAEHRARMGEFI